MRHTLGNMKTFIILSALLAVALAAEIKYTTKYDNVDLDEILNNDRLLNAYFKCLVDKGTCTPDGKELKSVIPDALTNGCAKCNESQKQGTKRVIEFLSKNKHEMWQELKTKYDPEGIYEKQFNQQASSLGITP